MDYAVVGDVMLDKYIFTDSWRPCPEYTGFTYHVDRVEYHLGGAANTALSLSKLANTVLIGGLGQDEHNELFIDSLGSLVFDEVTIPKTTVKTRIFYKDTMVLRLDEEQIFDASPLEKYNTPPFDVIILSDYNKGMVSAELVRQYVRSGRFVAADPKGKSIEKYEGVDLLTPNLLELETLTGESDYEKAIEIALKYVRGLLVTKSEKGMEYVSKICRHSVHSLVRNPENVSGAGDLALAGFTFHLTSGKTVVDSLDETNLLLKEAFSKNSYTTLHV